VVPLAALLLLLSSACTDPWREVFYVDGLRVLALRAEPPDLAPGDATRLDSLVVDTARAGPHQTRSCGSRAILIPRTRSSPRARSTRPIADAESGDSGQRQRAPRGVRVLTPPVATTTPVYYQSDPHVFDQLAADDPLRTKGVLAIVLMAAIAAEPPTTVDGMNELLQ